MLEMLEDRVTPSTYFVDDDAAAGGTGGQADPFGTISAAAAIAVAGDTVIVESGVYDEQVTLPNSGAQGAPIIFKAADGADAVVTGGFHAFLINSKSWITIQGFEIKETALHGIRISNGDNILVANNEIHQSGLPAGGSQGFGAGIFASNTTNLQVSGNFIHNNTTQGVRISGSSDVTISDNDISRSGQAIGGTPNVAPGILLSNTANSLLSSNTVYENSNSGILITDDSTGIDVISNVSYDNARAFAGASAAAAGIDVRGPNNYIIGNTTYDNEDTGIQIFSVLNSPNPSVNNLIANNITYGNGDHGIDVLRSPGQIIVGNTVFANTTTGVNLEGLSTDVTVANNVMVDNGIDPPMGQSGNLRVEAGSTDGVSLDFDLFFLSDAAGGQVQIIWETTAYSSLADFVAATGMEINGIEADPLFADASAADFHLQAGSSAIDSADSGVAGWQDIDAEGNARVNDFSTANTGAGPRPFDDRGALEFQPKTEGKYFVDAFHPSCSDEGDGTLANPFCTIGAAEDRVQPGEKVVVFAGQYAEMVEIETSGTSEAPIVFAAAAGEEVIVTGAANGFRIHDQSWIAVKGFTIAQTESYGIRVKDSDHIIIAENDVSFAGQPVDGHTAKGIYLSNVSDSLVLGNTSHHNSDDGIYLTKSTGVELAYNTSYANARGHVRAAAGIKLYKSDDNTVMGNIAYGNEDSGFEINQSGDNLVVNNLSYQNGDHGFDILRSPGAGVIGNTAYGNFRSGVIVQGKSEGTTVVNNISTENGIGNPDSKGNISIDKKSIPDTTVDFNVVYSSSLAAGNALMTWDGVGYSSLAEFQAAGGQSANGIEADPLFADASGGDFHLQPGSPAIDSADSGVSGQQTIDAEGFARIDDPDTLDTGIGPRTYDDRGAFEFQPNGTGAAAGTLNDLEWDLLFSELNDEQADLPDAQALIFADESALSTLLSKLQLDNGFHFTGNWWLDFFGKKEKWFKDRHGTWFILNPLGELSRYENGQFTLIAALSQEIYADPLLLFDAPVQLPENVLQTLATLRINHGFAFTGNYWFNFAGQRGKWFQDRWGQWFALTPDGAVNRWHGGKLIPYQAAHPLVWDDPILLFDARVELSQSIQETLIELQQKNGFAFTGNWWLGFWGRREKWFKDASGVWHLITPQGTLYSWANGQLTRIADLGSLVYDDLNLLFDPLHT